jgi:hypothetical protein
MSLEIGTGSTSPHSSRPAAGNEAAGHVGEKTLPDEGSVNQTAEHHEAAGKSENEVPSTT